MISTIIYFFFMVKKILVTVDSEWILIIANWTRDPTTSKRYKKKTCWYRVQANVKNRSKVTPHEEIVPSPPIVGAQMTSPLAAPGIGLETRR
jgi:hypothetical protein